MANSSSITRRSWLKGASIASAAATLAVVTETSTASPIVLEMSAKDLCEYHMRQLVLNMQAIHDEEYGWVIDYKNLVAFITRDVPALVGGRVLS